MKVMLIGFIFALQALTSAITIDEWCPVISGSEPSGCAYLDTTYGCHVAATQPWCCARKVMRYNCGSEDPLIVLRIFQWNKDNSQTCLAWNPAQGQGYVECHEM